MVSTMAGSAALDVDMAAEFKHKPLDPGRRLIRLIKILPGFSKHGLVRCKLVHVALPPRSKLHEEEEGSTEAEYDRFRSLVNLVGENGENIPSYACLSYTWGEPNETHKIEINGKVYIVRKNLWQFLSMAAENLHYQFFWIDALCIDQANTSERNHQVQHMGNIYTQARAVFIWLGTDLELELVLHSIITSSNERTLWVQEKTLDRYGRPSRSLKNIQNGHVSGWFGMKPPTRYKVTAEFDMKTQEQSTGHDDRLNLQPWDRSKPNLFTDTTGKVEKLLEKITTHDYWSRAWVTQEVLLARRAVILAGQTAHDLFSLATKFRQAVRHHRDNGFENLIDMIIRQKLSLDKDVLEFQSWGMVNILHRLRNKQCAIRRDRIYSLLALCDEGAKLTVDYDVTEEQLMRQVLSLRESSMCFCSAAVVSNALGTTDHAPNDTTTEEAPFAEIHLYAYSLNSAVCPFCSNWVPFSWTRKTGKVFCLGITCPDTQGHLFWESTGNDQHQDQHPNEKQSTQPPGSIHAQSRQNNKSIPLCQEGAGIDIANSPWTGIYQLRFTYRALADTLRDDLNAGDLGLNACGHLWPNKSSTPASDMARLRLCEQN